MGTAPSRPRPRQVGGILPLPPKEPNTPKKIVNVPRLGTYYVNWSPNKQISLTPQPQYSKVLKGPPRGSLVAVPGQVSIQTGTLNAGSYYLQWQPFMRFNLVRTEENRSRSLGVSYSPVVM